MEFDLFSLIIDIGIPSAVMGVFIWVWQRRYDERQKADKEEREARQKQVDERELVREEAQFVILQSVQASIALGEATARAVQRIPDAHCNGDMHKALEYAEDIKHQQKDFLQRQAIKSIY